MYKLILFLITILISSVAFSNKLNIKELKMPKGFHIEIFSENIKHPREMAVGDGGIVFVGTSDQNVYAVIPHKDTKNEVKIIASHLRQPQGVAFHKGDLYVAEVHQIIRYSAVEKNLNHLPQPAVIANDFPLRKDDKGEQSLRHAWKTINFGPDDKLYTTISMPCDTCLPKNKYEGTITRMNSDGSGKEIYVKGIRNSVGFAWQPDTHELWFTDNGRDNLGDNIPPDKLCYALKKGLDFGFPYYLGIDENGEPIPDPQYGKLRSAQGISWEAFDLPAHVAALNMIFYTGNMFPAKYKNQILIAEHGSWNRSKKVGYRLTLVTLSDHKVISYTPFITGWLKNEKYWGRPVGLLVLNDGSLLISDDYANVIYRVTYH